MKLPRLNWLIVAAIYATFLLVLTACGPKTSSTMISAQIGTGADGASSNRIYVVESSVFKGAKYESRTILVLRDRQTGAEYLAIQGFGVMDMTRECTSNTDRKGHTTTTCRNGED